MSFVIMNVGTEGLYHKPGHYCEMYYKTERGAKIACAKLNKSFGNAQQWVIMETHIYWQSRPVKMKKVRSLMTGQEVEIPEDTPHCCDPSSETFWSM